MRELFSFQMHRKISGRVTNLVSLILGFAIALAGFLIQPVQAGPENPTPVCTGQSCTIKFEYSGSPYLWEPPSGATEVRFDLFGAQGGQGAVSPSAGGLGARISGQLATPPASLYIYVAGAGSRGAGVPGGYNGGGSAGSGHGDEGSGGGATDLRISAELADRVAVAGGGGGTGGFNWSTAGLGGFGGGLVGGDGGWGQAAPGLGGSQTTGGSSGQSNGGSAAEPGGLGVGGKGASSSFSGGGGGGGGFFGGGGGGSDTDTCCFNAGGGGGGSSYAKPGSTLDVQMASGVRVGNGIAYISYVLVPENSAASPTPTPSPSPSPSPPQSAGTLVPPSAEPTSSPEATQIPTPVPAPELVPAPVSVVEHLLPVPAVTSGPPVTYEPSVDAATPAPDEPENIEPQEMPPVEVELVEHLALQTTASVAAPIEPVLNLMPGGKPDELETNFYRVETSNSSASSSASANLNQAATLRVRETSRLPIFDVWQLPAATLSVAAGGVAVWRKLRRKTPSQFVRIS